MYVYVYVYVFVFVFVFVPVFVYIYIYIYISENVAFCQSPFVKLLGKKKKSPSNPGLGCSFLRKKKKFKRNLLSHFGRQKFKV